MSEPKKLKRVVIKEEFMALTGDHVAAIILNQLLYWTEIVNKSDEQLIEEKKRAEKNGKEIAANLRNGWIYKTAKEMLEEIMINTSEKTVERRLKQLVEQQILECRRNPEYKWDRTLQYRVNLAELQSSLHKMGYPLGGYTLSDAYDTVTNGEDNVSIGGDTESDRTGHSVVTIPEITTEITSKITSEKEVVVIDDDKSVIEEIGNRPLYIFSKPEETYRHYFQAEANEEQLILLRNCLEKGIEPSTISWAMRETKEKGKTWPYCMKILERFQETGVSTAQEAERKKQEYGKASDKRTDGQKESFASAHKRVFGFDCNNFQNELLIKYIDQDGMEEDLIIYAIERAATNMTGYKFQYISRIIEDYAKAKIKTVAQAESYENEIAKKKMESSDQVRGRGQGKKTDDVPEHVRAQIERQKQEAAVASESSQSGESYEAKKRRVDEILKQMEAQKRERSLS